MSINNKRDPGADADRSFAWCSWHRNYSSTARLIQIHEAGTGPGGGLFACAPCREIYGLVPVADQP